MKICFLKQPCSIGIVDKFTNLSKIDFSMKCSTADFPRSSGRNVKIFL